MITLELAAHQLFVQVGGALAFVALGALQTRPGQIGLVLSGLSWVMLLYVVVEGRGTRRIIRDALTSFVPELDGPRVPLRDVLFPVSWGRAEVQRIRDVVYARIAGRRLRLDVYMPREPGSNRPAVMQIHGGGWVVGDKRTQGIPLCLHLARCGWVVFNVNYRLSPGATFPDHLVDLKRALAWIRTHAAEYGVDPSFVAVTGGSAGGHLAALMALTQNDARYQPGFEEADTSIQAAVPFYGVYDFTNRFGAFHPIFVKRLLQAHVMKAFFDEEPEKFAEASPIDRVGPDAPPFFVIHGDRDTMAPLSDARKFVAALRSVSKSPVLFAEIHGAQHAFDMLTSPRSVPVIEGVERFLEEVRKRPSPRGDV
jgi:acetyl esterase/lipase